MTISTPDSKAFREVLGLFPTGVAIIATRIDGQDHAMTANAVSSLSLDPPLVLFCPAKRARFSQLLPRASGFSINFLRDEQEALSTYFAGVWQESAPPRYRFVVADGLPRLEGSLASLLCSKREVYEAGDHWLVTLEVRQLHRGIDPLRPLLFYRGKYRRVDARDGTSAPDLANSADEPVQMYYHEP
ncbi:MAG TPA: flavin reductase family protein [Steroidobacteraceae bacterium]|nr:flavin reductase family protein [Steroidobacteraceae bacterium]